MHYFLYSVFVFCICVFSSCASSFIPVLEIPKKSEAQLVHELRESSIKLQQEWPRDQEYCRYSRIQCKKRNGQLVIVRLNLSNLDLQTLPNDFALPYLEELNLSNNFFSEIPQMSVPSLRRLNFSNNELGKGHILREESTSCTVGIYSRHAIDVSFSNNGLTFLPFFPALLSDADLCLSPAKLELSHNPLGKVSEEQWNQYFQVHTTITHLLVDNTNLTTLPEPVGLTFLESVSARFNRLGNVTKQIEGYRLMPFDLRGNPSLSGEAPQKWCDSMVVNKIKFDATPYFKTCSTGSRTKNFFSSIVKGVQGVVSSPVVKPFL